MVLAPAKEPLELLTPAAQMKNVARLAWVQPEMEMITKQWKAAGGYSAPPKITDGYQKQMKELFKKHNCSPTRSLVGIFVQVKHCKR